MDVNKYMTAPAVTTDVNCPVERLAAQMQKHGVGFLPVMDGDRIVGTVTDRDLVLSVLPEIETMTGKTAADIMNKDVLSCHESDSVEVAAALMGDHQIRRIPVLDNRGRLSGVLSIGDIAENVSEQLAGETLGEIVETR